MNLPTFETYCPNTTPGNALRFELGALSIWYSYRTPVAFAIDGVKRVRRNEQRDGRSWGPTTGKHLNAIDGGAKADRISGEEFEKLLSEALAWNPSTR